MFNENTNGNFFPNLEHHHFDPNKKATSKQLTAATITVTIGTQKIVAELILRDLGNNTIEEAVRIEFKRRIDSPSWPKPLDHKLGIKEIKNFDELDPFVRIKKLLLNNSNIVGFKVNSTKKVTIQ